MPSRFPAIAHALLSATILLAAAASPSAATAQQIVKWTDASGHVHFSDHAPPGHTTVTRVDVHDTQSSEGSTPSQSTPDSHYGDSSSSADPSSNDAEAAAELEREQKRRHEQQQKAQDEMRRKSDQAVDH